MAREVWTEARINEFALERREEALDDGVVVALAARAHGAFDASVAQHSAIVEARVLRAAAGMREQVRVRASLP